MLDDIHVSAWGSVNINVCNIYVMNFQENDSILGKNVITYWRAHLHKLAAGIATCDVTRIDLMLLQKIQPTNGKQTDTEIVWHIVTCRFDKGNCMFC